MGQTASTEEENDADGGSSPFDRNLVENSSGENGLEGWQLIANGGHSWKVESPVVGCKDQDYFPSAFVTSFGLCLKEQCIDLVAAGVEEHILDTLKPTIIVSEWHCSRNDCGSEYQFKCWLNAKVTDGCRMRPIEKKESTVVTKQWEGGNWQKTEFRFNDYPSGVRQVVIRSGGTDLQFWAGHYGPKIAQSSVVCLRPDGATSVLRRNTVPAQLSGVVTAPAWEKDTNEFFDEKMPSLVSDALTKTAPMAGVLEWILGWLTGSVKGYFISYIKQLPIVGRHASTIGITIVELIATTLKAMFKFLAVVLTAPEFWAQAHESAMVMWRENETDVLLARAYQYGRKMGAVILETLKQCFERALEVRGLTVTAEDKQGISDVLNDLLQKL